MNGRAYKVMLYVGCVAGVYAGAAVAAERGLAVAGELAEYLLKIDQLAETLGRLVGRAGPPGRRGLPPR